MNENLVNHFDSQRCLKTFLWARISRGPVPYEIPSRFLPTGGTSYLLPGWVLIALSGLVTPGEEGDDHGEF